MARAGDLADLLEADLARRAAPVDLRRWIERAEPKHAPLPWHLGQLVDLFEQAIREPTFALVSMPPRHAKSTTVRRAIAYSVLRRPERLNAFVTYATDYAGTHSRMIRRLVGLHGGRLATDAKNVKDWRTTEEGGLAATGILGQLTGKGFPGLMVVDDPIKNRREAESALVRERIWDGFNDDVYTRLEPGGSIIVVATRWREDDLIGRLERERDAEGHAVWKVLNLPALRDPETGDPSDAPDAVALWPHQFPVAALRRIQRKIGPYGWWSLYQGRPRPRDGKVFKVAARWSNRPEGVRIVLAVDPAGSKRSKSNHTVAVAIGVKVIGGALYGWLLGLVRFQLTPPEAAPRLLAFQRRFGAKLHIEGSRDGIAQRDNLKLLAPGLDTRLVTAQEDKYIRAQALSAAWNGDAARGEPVRFFVPERAEQIDATEEDLANYLRVMERFTGLGDGEDDDVDATAHAWNAAIDGADMEGAVVSWNAALEGAGLRREPVGAEAPRDAEWNELQDE